MAAEWDQMCVSVLSCPPVMNNYHRLMVVCHKHNVVKIAQPCKAFIWSRQPDETSSSCPAAKWRKQNQINRIEMVPVVIDSCFFNTCSASSFVSVLTASSLPARRFVVFSSSLLTLDAISFKQPHAWMALCLRRATTVELVDSYW